MISSSFLTDSPSVLVVDASVVINLNATARAHDIILALPHIVVVTDNAMTELVNGTRNGHDDAHQLQELVDKRLIELVTLGESGIGVYESLIDGSALCTLDDGEAATIAYAHEKGGVAAIDERKARRICGENFPSLQVLSTVDLLLDDLIFRALGKEEQTEAVYRALTLARMRVPPERLSSVLAIIGEERIASCSSLPKTVRVV